ncbi:unnamed protein product [Amoebophrya sp. A120]|nr:unnamed protein product [Amoebophrya sp. A120]|eukprot:GSA120T00018993001.1
MHRLYNLERSTATTCRPRPKKCFYAYLPKKSHVLPLLTCRLISVVVVQRNGQRPA